MTASRAAGRLLVGLAVMGLLGGCASNASRTPAPTTPAATAMPPAAVAAPTPTATATAAAPTSTTTPTPTPAATPSVVVTYDITYESTDPVLTPDALDVYAPAKAGPWPVARGPWS